jgi:hypothetical protein
MGFMIRDIEAESKFSSELSLEALNRAVPLEELKQVIQAEGVQVIRERKLNMVVIMLVIIAMSIYTRISIGHVMRKIAQGLRFIWPDPNYPVPQDSAITYRRYQLRAAPMAALFHRVCRPLTTPETPGAFLFGLRLMAIDGTVEDVPDSPENVAAFGRHHGNRGKGGFPQVQVVYLAECGAHAIIDAGFWPVHTSERVGGLRLLRAVEADMLVMWDRGFHDFDMFGRVRQRGAHVLGRLPAHVKPKRVRGLPDGSSWAYIYPSDYKRRHRGEHLLVRIIEYTLVDPALPGYGEVHRLITTLLDPEQARRGDPGIVWLGHCSLRHSLLDARGRPPVGGRPRSPQLCPCLAGNWRRCSRVSDGRARTVAATVPAVVAGHRRPFTTRASLQI